MKKLSKKLLALLLVFAMLVPTGTLMVNTSAAAVSIPDDAVMYNGHYYKAYDISMSWTDAKAYCEELGGHLVTITTQSEQTFIENTFLSGSSTMWFYMIGGYRKSYTSTEWQWITGENFDFENWSTPEEPKQNIWGQLYIWLFNSSAPDSYVSNDIVINIPDFKWFSNESECYHYFYNTNYTGFICEWDALDENNHAGERYIKDNNNATCTEDGYTGDIYCADCNKKLESGETIPATGHDWGDWETVTPATCEEDGLERRICKNDASHVEENVISFNIKNGDIIEFGTYPQTLVTDESILTALNAKELNWISYNYYSGNNNHGSAAIDDYMKYADVEFNGERYRAVFFDKYRPYRTYRNANTFQDNNGYFINTVYWFKYEPLSWKILDIETGFVVSEKSIDAQAYCNVTDSQSAYNLLGKYANDYETSSIREWLNDDFYNLAFSDDEKTQIYTTELDNSAEAGTTYDSQTTYDKVFLLSYDEALNKAYFNDEASRKIPNTDYAECQGSYNDSKYNIGSEHSSPYYWLRTADDIYASNACTIMTHGALSGCLVTECGVGVRPAICISLDSFVKHTPNEKVEEEIAEPTCTESGRYDDVVYCSVCESELSREEKIIPATGHSFSDWTEIKKPTVLAEGEMSRTCSVCSEVETKITDRVTIDIENTNEYGIANFTVVNAQTLAPVKNANIFISTENDGENTFYTDEEGKVSIVLPVGENVITAHAKGLISRTLTIDIVHGMNEIPAIGLGNSPIVEAELITTPMTKEEIEDAGIDTTAPGNNNVIKYEVTFEFTAKDDEPKKEIVTETFYVNSNGEHFYQNNNQSSTHEIFGKPVTIYPTERFYLIITGDIIWLKEMFHVQLFAYNNSNTDWIEDVVATLNLPEGLSLADMIEGEQTLSQQIGKISEGGQADCEWYIRGDKEGVYDITATLDGRIMPFNEEFSNEYTAESAIKVYSGKGMSLSFEVPSTTYCGDEYPVKIILKNISDKPIYNVAHILTGIQQSKVTHYSNGEVIEELYVKDALNASKFVEEFKAGDEIVIEVTAEILFKSEQYKDCFFELVDIILGAKELGEAINNNFGFPTEHDWSEWEAVKEATCGEAGQEKRVCKNNSEHVEYRDVEKLPHNWDNGVINPASTCKTHGTKTYTCQNDASHTKTEEVSLDENNHTGDTYIKDDKNATCTEDGYTGDTYCSDCDKKLESGEIIPTTGHVWGAWETVKAPTYTEMGEEKRVCEKGDAEETRSLPVLTRPSDENENIETEKTVEYDSATGEAVIKLVASSKGEKITVNSRTPLDIVLVLDQSGSMEGDLLKKLKTATEDFTNAIYQDALENNIDHRIAMVGFAMQNQYNFGSEYPQYLNTEVLTTGGAPVKYNSLSTAKMNEVYRNALVSVNVDGTLNPILTLAKNNLEAKGATAADLGLDMACQIFAQNENDGSRKRIVVFMTDGVPTYKSDYMEETATNATTKANLLKDAYDADLYSVGVLSGSNTNKAKTFLNNIASKDENNKALYFDCADADKLVEDFQTIATQSTTVTTDFADITLIDTVSSAFTLTAVQENELRKNVIEKLGITNDDITITRYADGTTEVKLEHIDPVAVTDGDDINYVIDIDFRVSANEKALIAGSYGTNTDNAGVLVGTSDVYENNFAVPGANVENAEGVIYFTVNGIVYHVVRVHKGDSPEAPEFTLDGEYTFSGWDIPDEVVFDGGKLTVEATLSQKEYTITWNTADKTTVDTYHAGDIIDSPTVGLNSNGEEFLGWNKTVPVTMPAENLEFTATYGTHEHSYTENVLKKVSCGVEGKIQHICTCGDSYVETIDALTHKWSTSATSTDGSETAYSYVYCVNCGESPDKTLSYKITGKSGSKEVSYDLKLTDAENITVQPDGNITISLPVPSNMKNAKNVKIYRVEEDGTKTNLNGTVKNGYITFTTDHFSIYIVEAVYDCDEAGIHTDDNTDNVCDICGESLKHEEPDDASKNCSHYCHDEDGFMHFFWKLFCFFYKLFGIEEKHVCACGVAHW